MQSQCNFFFLLFFLVFQVSVRFSHTNASGILLSSFRILFAWFLWHSQGTQRIGTSFLRWNFVGFGCVCERRRALFEAVYALGGISMHVCDDGNVSFFFVQRFSFWPLFFFFFGIKLWRSRISSCFVCLFVELKRVFEIVAFYLRGFLFQSQ